MDEHLTALLATHTEALRALLPDSLWPLTPCKVEQFGPLTKYTLGPLEDGRWVMLHHITEADDGAPHDHSVEFESHVLVGGYVERIFKDGQPEEVLREAGSTHVIAPECIHQLISLPEGACWTLCFAGPVIRQWRHYPELV